MARLTAAESRESIGHPWEYGRACPVCGCEGMCLDCNEHREPAPTNPEERRRCEGPVVVQIVSECRLKPGHLGKCKAPPLANEWHAPGRHVCNLAPVCADGVVR